MEGTNATELNFADLQAGVSVNGAAGSEVDYWKNLCRQLVDQRNQMAKQLAEVQQERDNYRRGIYASMAKDDIEFTKEEVLAAVASGRDFKDLIDELDLKFGCGQ